MTHMHNAAYEADPESHDAGVRRASDVPTSRGSRIAGWILLIAVISLLVPKPELWFLDDTPRRAASLIDDAQDLAEEDEYNKRDVDDVIEVLTDLSALMRTSELDEETEAIVADMEAGAIALEIRVEDMRGRDRLEPPLPGLDDVESLRAHFDGIVAANEALVAFADVRVQASAVVALLAALYLVIAPAFDHRLNTIPVFGAVQGGMKVGHARAVVRAVILLCGAALVMIFQPNIASLYTVGAGLVVLGGLAFNMVPLAQPGRRIGGVIKAGVIVLVILVVAILLALGSAELYSLYLENQ